MNALRAIDRTKIFTPDEILEVLIDLKRKRRSVNTRQNAIIFRLATFCGLRVSEVVGLKMAHVKLGSQRPHIDLPATITKRRKARKVLIWDGATLADLIAWKAERDAQGAQPGDRFVCSQSKATRGKALSTRNAQARFKHAIKVLGDERTKGAGSLSIHSGRHTFCSIALASGRTLPEVRDAAGHANITTTSIYLHAVGANDDTIGDLLSFAKR